MISALAAICVILYALFTVIYLVSKPPDCGESHWTFGFIDTFGLLGLLAALGGIAAGVWASVHPPRKIGLVAILFNLGLIVGGLVLVGISFQHSGLEFCDM